MDNLSTVSTDIISQIGALELGDIQESHGDDVLEWAGSASVGPTYGGCTDLYRAGNC